MKAIVSAVALAVAVSLPAKADTPAPKALKYQVNDHVAVFISNQPCQKPKFKGKYPLEAAAVKLLPTRTEVLYGCYTHEGDEVVIQWDDYRGRPSDTSRFPANLFLMGKIQGEV